jgi:hypothetical protein
MPQRLPTWPANIAHDHRLRSRVDLFIDESGPREDGTLTLGILIVESPLATAALNFFEWHASQLLVDHPAFGSREIRR